MGLPHRASGEESIDGLVCARRERFVFHLISEEKGVALKGRFIPGYWPLVMCIGQLVRT